MAKARLIEGLDSHAPTGRNARIIARARLEDMYSWARYVDNPYHIRELHDLRIAIKRLRYTLEIFEDVLPVEDQLIIKELEQLQEELGSLHDSDVMIALLRLCLANQDGGNVYDTLLLRGKKTQGKAKSLVQPELVADLLYPAVASTAEERYGLEQLLLKQQQLREKQYTMFRRHWYQLQARDFRREILDILEVK